MLEIRLPGSKSISTRALTCRAVSGLDIALPGLTQCDDTVALAKAFEALASHDKAEIDIGSGAAPLRFFMAVAASMPGKEVTISCSPQLARRPHSPLICALRSLGADITELPGGQLHIRGRKLEGGRVDIDASMSSQFISALMLASPLWKQTLSLHITTDKCVSAPYIRMTGEVMRLFCEAVDAGHLVIPIEPDWSAASYIYEAVALGTYSIPPVLVGGLLGPERSIQGDARCAEIFAPFVDTNFTPEGAVLTRRQSADAGPTDIDMGDIPDLVPAYAATLCGLGIPFTISGIAHLRHKESDRIAALVSELGRMGYALKAEGADTLRGFGIRPLNTFNEKAIDVSAHGDHRMAMALTMLAEGTNTRIRLDDESVVSKSFPDFFDIARRLKS